MADHFVAPMGDDFVYIHVGLGSASCLPDDKRKMIIQFPAKDFIANPNNNLRFFLRQLTKLAVGQSCGFF